MFICTRQPRLVTGGEMTVTLQQINQSVFVDAFLDQMVLYLGWLILGAVMCWVLYARDSGAGGIFHWVTAVQQHLGGWSCSKHVVLPVWENTQDLPHSGVELRMYGLAVIFDRTVHMCVTLLGSCGLRVLSMTSASSQLCEWLRFSYVGFRHNRQNIRQLFLLFLFLKDN